jgi:hypothetical protein
MISIKIQTQNSKIDPFYTFILIAKIKGNTKITINGGGIKRS